MPPSARLPVIVDELDRKRSYAYGDRRLEPPIAGDEAREIVEALSGEVDEGVAARARQAAEQGFRIHCHAGCTKCCNVVVMVYRPEALRIAEYLRRPEAAEALDRFRAAYDRWKAALADVLPRLTELSVEHRDQGPYFDLIAEATARRVMCAFNHEGRCQVYPVRPLGCRDAHALDSDAYCANDHPSGARTPALQYPPLDRLTVRAARLIRAVHNSMPDTRRHEAEALCQAVALLLGVE